MLILSNPAAKDDIKLRASYPEDIRSYDQKVDIWQVRGRARGCGAQGQRSPIDMQQTAQRCSWFLFSLLIMPPFLHPRFFL